MTTPSVLILPDFSKVFMMPQSWVLMKDQRTVAFFSKALKGKMLHFSTYEKELLALVSVVKKWRPYLLG